MIGDPLADRPLRSKLNAQTEHTTCVACRNGTVIALDEHGNRYRGPCQKCQPAVEAPAPMVPPNQEHGKRSTVPAPEQLWHLCCNAMNPKAEGPTIGFFLLCRLPRYHDGPHKNDVYAWPNGDEFHGNPS